MVGLGKTSLACLALADDGESEHFVLLVVIGVIIWNGGSRHGETGRVGWLNLRGSVKYFLEVWLSVLR